MDQWSGKRVYTYVGDDGTVYYSFTKHPSTITHIRRVTLQSRIGDHLYNFLFKMRHLGEGIARGEGEDG